MIYKTVSLIPTSPEITLEIFVPEQTKNYIRKAILILPGGGYCGLSTPREGEMIAQAFIPLGYCAFVLKYSVTSNKTNRYYPSQLIEASLAMKYIRDHAEEFGIDPEQVYSVGFSAGGHLCATLGTMWHRKEIYDYIQDMPFGYNKPNGVMLIYPVISGVQPYGHHPSIYNLLGTNTPTSQQLEYVSPELWVDENSSPAFIFHTSDDNIVNVKNSTLMANAYYDKKLNCELHVIPGAHHGLATGTEITWEGYEAFDSPRMASWIPSANLWTETIKSNAKFIRDRLK